MKKTHIIAFLILSFLIASFITSCTSSDEEVIVVRDTVIINVTPPPLKNQVSVETINKRFIIQLAAFNKEENVNAFVKQAKEKLGVIPEVRKHGNLFEVTVGLYNYANTAQDYLTVVKSKGFPDAFIKSID